MKSFFLIYVTAGGIFLVCKSLKQKSFSSEACGILVYPSLALPCSPKAESTPSALETWRLDHCINRDLLRLLFLFQGCSVFYFLETFFCVLPCFFSKFFLASLFCFGVFLVRSFSQVSIALFFFFFAWWEGACLPTQGESSPWLMQETDISLGVTP